MLQQDYEYLLAKIDKQSRKENLAYVDANGGRPDYVAVPSEDDGLERAQLFDPYKEDHVKAAAKTAAWRVYNESTERLAQQIHRAGSIS